MKNLGDLHSFGRRQEDRKARCLRLGCCHCSFSPCLGLAPCRACPLAKHSNFDDCFDVNAMPSEQDWYILASSGVVPEGAGETTA